MRAFVPALCVLVGCATIHPGEVGLKRRLGRLQDDILGPGPVSVNPFLTQVVRVPVRTSNVLVALDLPSREGLNVRAEISILYRVEQERVPELLQSVGPDYEDVLVVSVFRSAAADVSARFLAKDMHTASRAEIEEEIRVKMATLLEPRGLVVEAVLLKSIQLPPGLYAAVEAKLAAEQDAQRMEFILQRERMEAQRRAIEAEGIAESQRILASGLTPEVMEWQRIKAFQELATSPNAKVIIGNGALPTLTQTAVD